METLKEFRPESLKRLNTEKTPKRTRKKKSNSRKTSSPSIFTVSNVALLVGVLLLGYGKLKKSAEVKRKNQIIAQMSVEIDKLKIEKMKYMADKKIQAIANQTLNSKKTHIQSLEALVAKGKNDLEKVSNELAELKKFKMTELQYKVKLAQIENEYQRRLDAHNLNSTKTITNMGKKMMAEVDKIKTRAPASSSSAHVVSYKSFKNTSQKLKLAPAKSRSDDSDLEIGKWRDSDIEF